MKANVKANHHEEKPPGDVLVFLSGCGPIINCCDRINEVLRDHDLNDFFKAYMLYSALDQEDQDEARDKWKRPNGWGGRN